MRKLFFSFLLALMMPMTAGAQEIYAVYDGEGTLTFYYDNLKASRSGTVYSPTPNEKGYPEWHVLSGMVTKAVFDDSFASCTTLTSTAWWFYDLWRLSSIIGFSNFKTDNVTNMHGMFTRCFGLTSLDLTGLKTDNVTDMNDMFNDCYGLTSLDVTGFKTDNVTDMGFMFWGCSGLTSLDVTGFKTDNVTDMGGMFWGCSSLTSLDLSNFKTDKVTTMGNMFCKCSSLTSIDLTGFKTNNVWDMAGMFSFCSGLTSINLTGLKTDNVKDINTMFYGCSSLTTIDLSGFKTDNVTFMGRLFYECSSLTTIYAGDGWNTAKVTSGDNLFLGCTNLVGGAGTKFNASHKDYTYARIDGGSDNPGYFTAKAEGGPQTWAEGDLNHDGKVDAADVVVLVNMIMNQNLNQ